MVSRSPEWRGTRRSPSCASCSRTSPGHQERTRRSGWMSPPGTRSHPAAAAPLTFRASWKMGTPGWYRQASEEGKAFGAFWEGRSCLCTPSCSRAACWQPRPQTRRASGDRNPLTLGIVLGIKPLPTALVVAQQGHGSGGHAASFTPTKTPSISSPLFPRGSQHRRCEVTLPAFGGSWRRRLVTGELAKDGHGSWRDPRYLQRHISVLPHAPAHAGARRRGRTPRGALGWAEGCQRLHPRASAAPLCLCSDPWSHSS